MRELKEAGLSVPGDVSVIGFDDVDACQYCTPTLTTVAMPLREIGATAVQLLQNQIAADEVLIEHRVLPTQFIQRESTGPAPN